MVSSTSRTVLCGPLAGVTVPPMPSDPDPSFAHAAAADSKSKTYGSADPALTWQVTSGSLVNGDSLNGALTRSAGENVGSYTIDASALANGNYVVTAIDGTLTISNNAGISAAIANVQSQATSEAAVARPGTALPTVAAGENGRVHTSSATAVAQSGGLIMVQGDEQASDRPTTRTTATVQSMPAAGLDASGFMRVFVVRGGINADFSQKKNN